MDSPQGVCWLSGSVLAVCDTNNHAVRTVHLDDGTVEVLVGTGEQSLPGDLGEYQTIWLLVIAALNVSSPKVLYA